MLFAVRDGSPENRSVSIPTTVNDNGFKLKMFFFLFFVSFPHHNHADFERQSCDCSDSLRPLSIEVLGLTRGFAGKTNNYLFCHHFCFFHNLKKMSKKKMFNSRNSYLVQCLGQLSCWLTYLRSAV